MIMSSRIRTSVFSSVYTHILDASGMGCIIEQVMQERQETECFAEDGSTRHTAAF